MRNPRKLQQDASERLVRVCLKVAARLNDAFFRCVSLAQILTLPQWSSFQQRVYFIWFLQFFSSDLCLVAIAKTLQVVYGVSNFMLLLSLGSVAPFIRVIYDLWHFIPCPPAPSLVSNLLLLFSFIVLVLLSTGVYDNFWSIYAYIFAIWPWLALASMISRLYFERNESKNPFSPLRELPLLGLMSAGAHVLALTAAKEISMSDCFVLLLLDPAPAAAMASVALGRHRRQLHLRYVKTYVIMFFIAVAYKAGDLGQGMARLQGPSYHHWLYIFARVLFVGRSIFVKWKYSAFYMSALPVKPPESGLLFYSVKAPKKHRFARFPAPTLLTLDAIFDSGLRDSDFHGMGYLGTMDLHMLTEATYLLPVSALCAFLYEQDTLKYGIMPPGYYGTSVSAESIILSSQQGGLTQVEEAAGTPEVLVVICLVAAFCLSRLLVPWTTARAAFDRGSSLHMWKYQPVIVALPCFFFDVLSINGSISNFQVMMVLLLCGFYAHYRDNLWTNFKRKLLLLSTQELHYYQPSALRQLQRRTLLEFLSQTSTDDYGFMLLQTAIRHGDNIRELARDTSVTVWDPAPTATAAWKLAFSLVSKSLRKNKSVRKVREAQKAEIKAWIEHMVLNLVDGAVDFSEGHGKRLKGAGVLAKFFAKRSAVRRLRALAEGRRILRNRRRTGQLASEPMTLATAGGILRSAHDFPAVSPPEPRRRAPLALAAPPGQPALPDAALTSPGSRSRSGNMHLSLTQEVSGMSPSAGEEEPLLSVPGALAETTDAFGTGARPMAPATDGVPRGVFALSQLTKSSSQPGGSVVLSFGDARRGQLGVEQSIVARHVPGSDFHTIEELRGCSPVQVEAAGVSSLVIGGSGHVWGFGSNRALELGMRKEVTQVYVPQRVKSLRDHQVVQLAGSCSASGQAFRYALAANGEVYTFGTSVCGALGQGEEVRSTAPLLLRITTQVRIRQVAAGARHGFLVSDGGQIFAMGDNSHGQLGLGKMMPKSAHSPVELPGELGQSHVALLAVGDFHALATTEDGHLYAWGANASGQLGLGGLNDQCRPQVITELQDADITSLACGARHSLVVAARGTKVWAFGSNAHGQLGIGPSSYAEGQQRSVPSLCQALTSKLEMEVVQVAAAASHSLAVTRAGEVFAFGDNSFGQLGFPPEGEGKTESGPRSTQRSRLAREVDKPRAHAEGVARLWLPARIVGLARYRVRAISTAEMHTVVLAS